MIGMGKKKRLYMFTGGHVTPALATIEELLKTRSRAQIAFVGRKYAIEGSRTISEEYRIMRERNIRFITLTAGRFKREGGLRVLTSLLKVPVGLIQAFWIVHTVRPDVIVSFGGYVALPVVVTGWLMRIPAITHEQTRRPGLANRIISRLSRHTCTSFPDAESRIGLSGPITHTGLPIRERIFSNEQFMPFKFPSKTRPLIFIVGGSTGSVSINTVVYDALPALVRMYSVVHQTGQLSFTKARERKSALSTGTEYYIPVPYLDEPDYAALLSRADLIVGRSGANTVMEIAAAGKAAVFIPLPWASENEQYYNAEFLRKAGSAVILPQHKLTSDSLVRTIRETLDNIDAHRASASTVASDIPHDGAKRFVSVIESL